jgi:hypothetical protein
MAGVKGKVGFKKQPLFGANSPGAGLAKRVLGSQDKSAQELKRNSNRMMAGDPGAAAAEGEKGIVPNPEKSAVSKGLHGDFEAPKTAQQARTARVNQMVSLMGKPQNAVEAESDIADKGQYKDWQETPKSATVVVAKQKKMVGGVNA